MRPRPGMSLFGVSSQTKPGLRVLMVDDSEEDIFFVQRAFEKSGVADFFQSVKDGSEAISYLRAEGAFSDRGKFPFPNVLLTDLKMPGMDGFALLEWLQRHHECKVIPTIALTSSSIESDIHQVYVLGCNAYIVKPNDFNELVKTIKITYDFWSRCQTPKPPPGERCA
jgi:CheY-like chemotaxis protein